MSTPAIEACRRRSQASRRLGAAGVAARCQRPGARCQHLVPSMNISSTDMEVCEAGLEHSLQDETVYSSLMTVLRSAAVLLLVVSCVAALLAAHRAFVKVRELPVDVQLKIQDMVRERVATHWPFVRAYEYRVRPAAGLVAVGEWIAFTASWSMLNAKRRRNDGLLVGKVLQVGVAPVALLQSDYWAPADHLKVAIYDRVPGTDHFVKWSGDMQHCGVQPQAVLAVGFCMEPVESLPLSWHFELRRPAGQRRIGPAFVMPLRVQAQLMPLGPLTERLPGQHGHPKFA